MAIHIRRYGTQSGNPDDEARLELGRVERQDISPSWSCDGPETAGTVKKINLLLAGLCIIGEALRSRKQGEQA